MGIWHAFPPMTSLQGHAFVTQQPLLCEVPAAAAVMSHLAITPDDAVTRDDDLHRILAHRLANSPSRTCCGAAGDRQVRIGRGVTEGHVLQERVPHAVPKGVC